MKMGLEFRFKKNILISSVKPGHNVFPQQISVHAFKPFGQL